MKKHLKLLLVLLVLSLTVAAIAITVGASESSEGPALYIKSFSVSLENAVFMNFKVQGTGIEDPTQIKLLLWEGVPEEYKKGSEDAVLSTEGTESATGYGVFKYTNLAAKDMTKYVYACAYANVDGVEVYSAPVKLSIVMYAYLQKNATNPDEGLVELLNGMLDYGALAQTYFNHNIEFLANETVYQLSVANGHFEDNFSLGWYFEGQSFTLTADPAPDGYAFSHWENSAGEDIGNTEVLEYTASKVDTYTAVYEETIAASSEGLKFTLNADGESYTVTGRGTCTDTDIVITTYNGLPVTAIGDRAFEDSAFKDETQITSVTFGENSQLTIIGDRAFFDCKSLTSIDIPDSVTSIGEYAFNNCTSLKSVTFGENSQPTDIASYAFFGCSSLTSIDIPDSVTSIGKYAFNNCTRLKSVTFCENSQLTSIGNYAFEYCSSLTSIDIPDSVTSIGSNAFEGCTSLASVTFGKNSQLRVIYSWAFYYCASLSSVTFGDNSQLTTIDGYAFYYCTSLTSIDIPDSVRNISGYAFYYCPSLTSINVDEDNGKYKSIDGNLYSKDGKTLIQYAIGKTDTSFTIPDSVTSIGGLAFRECTSLTSVTIGNSVTSIGGNAFYNCESLTSIDIPDSVTSIDGSAFRGCTSLSSVTFGENSQLTSIGGDAFRTCTSLTSIDIPDKVTSIGPAAFAYCTSLTSVTFKNTSGWWYSSDSTATSGTSISSTDLENTLTAADYLKSTYLNYYWHRS